MIENERSRGSADRATRRRRGTSMVEMAMVLPLLVLMLLGTLDFGLLLARYQIVLSSAHQGARVASLFREDCRPPRVRQEVVREISLSGRYLGMGLLPTNVSLTGACLDGQNVEVEIVYEHFLTFVGGLLRSARFFGGPHISDLRVPLRVRVVMRNE